MTWVVGIAIAVFLYWVLILRPGGLSFWRVVARHPDAAYDHFMSEGCWNVFENDIPEADRSVYPSAEWDGPFRLWVPKLGRQVIVFGRVGEYERSQSEFSRRFGGQQG
jgi:hypothetical protein